MHCCLIHLSECICSIAFIELHHVECLLHSWKWRELTHACIFLCILIRSLLWKEKWNLHLMHTSVFTDLDLRIEKHDHHTVKHQRCLDYHTCLCLDVIDAVDIEETNHNEFHYCSPENHKRRAPSHLFHHHRIDFPIMSPMTLGSLQKFSNP